MKKIKSLKEYGYILRLKALYLPRNIGKMMINESISFFQNISEETQEAKSRLTYSFYLAICGQLDEAKNELMIAKNILKLSHASMHIIEVNMSAIRLLSNETDNSILEGLKRAEYTSLTAFDKLAVLNNKLVYCILKEDKNMISSIEEKILRLFEKENDKHIKAFMYYNLYYYYKFIEENEEKSMIYYNKAFKLRKHCKTLEARLANRNNIEDGTEFLLTRPFHVCFLSFWRFDPFF